MTDIRDTELGLAYDLLSNFVSVSPAQMTLLVTWAAATNIFRRYPAFARLDLAAVSKGCGKTTAMETTLALCPQSITIASSTQGSVKNWIDEYPDAVVGLDERDLIFGTMGRGGGASKELVAILNAGYAQNGYVLATRNGKAVKMPVYNGMATAGIGRAPGTLADRSVSIVLEKRLPQDTWVSVLHEKALRRAGKELGDWLDSRASQKVLDTTPMLADLISDEADPRDLLKLAPMAAVAQVAGCLADWREAEHEVRTGITSNPLPTRSEMLLDILASKVPGELVNAEAIRMLAADIGFTDGRLGDIEIASLMRQSGVESTPTNGQRGYRVPAHSAHLAHSLPFSTLSTLTTQAAHSRAHTQESSRPAQPFGQVLASYLVEAPHRGDGSG